MSVQYEMPSPNDIKILQHINNTTTTTTTTYKYTWTSSQTTSHVIVEWTYVLDTVSASITSHITHNQRQSLKQWTFVPWLKNTTAFSHHNRFQSSEHITLIFVAVKYTHSKQYALREKLRYLSQNKQHVGNVQARNKI